MRRLLVTCAVLLALAVPAVASARFVGPNDGTLVVRNADNGDGAGLGQDVRPVVTLVITGFAIGRVTGQGRIEIYYDPTSSSTPEVTGADSHRDIEKSFGTPPDTTDMTGTRWVGSGFTFRAVGGSYRVLIYGSGVYLFAGGHGQVWMTGQEDSPDGTYSLNDGAWRSLPLSGMRLVNATAG